MAQVMSFLSALVIGLGLVATGCSTQAGDFSAPTAQADSRQNEVTPNESENLGLAELSLKDRALAEKQKVCPVSGEPLGSMGAPVKVTVKGRVVFLCCEGCQEDLKTDPDKYLRKLDEAQKSK